MASKTEDFEVQDPSTIPDPPYTMHEGKPLIKVVLCLKRRKGMSREDFKEYYENNHTAVFKDVMPMPGLVRYIRRYVSPIRGVVDGKVRESGFDCFSEIWFDDMDLYKKYVAGALLDKEFRAIVAADEENVFDRDETAFCVVDEAEQLRHSQQTIGG